MRDLAGSPEVSTLLQGPLIPGQETSDNTSCAAKKKNIGVYVRDDLSDLFKMHFTS